MGVVEFVLLSNCKYTAENMLFNEYKQTMSYLSGYGWPTPIHTIYAVVGADRVVKFVTHIYGLKPLFCRIRRLEDPASANF